MQPEEKNSSSVTMENGEKNVEKNGEKNEECVAQELPTPDEVVQSKIVKNRLTGKESKFYHGGLQVQPMMNRWCVMIEE